MGIFSGQKYIVYQIIVFCIFNVITLMANNASEITKLNNIIAENSMWFELLSFHYFEFDLMNKLIFRMHASVFPPISVSLLMKMVSTILVIPSNTDILKHFGIILHSKWPSDVNIHAISCINIKIKLL